MPINLNSFAHQYRSLRDTRQGEEKVSSKDVAKGREREREREREGWREGWRETRMEGEGGEWRWDRYVGKEEQNRR